MTKKMISLDELSRYDGKIKDYISEQSSNITTFILDNQTAGSSDTEFTASNLQIIKDWWQACDKSDMRNIQFAPITYNCASNGYNDRSFQLEPTLIGYETGQVSIVFTNIQNYNSYYYWYNVSAYTNNDATEITRAYISMGSADMTTYVKTTGAQTIIGRKIFSTLPESALAPTTVNQLTNKSYVDSKAIQYSTMPTADSTAVGQVIQYIGTTDSSYTNGYFYIGVTDGGDPATYSWQNISVQETQITKASSSDIDSLFS